MMGVNGIARGSQTKIASALGVSDATISRDFRAILDMLNAGRCNLCGNAVRRASPKPYRLR